MDLSNMDKNHGMVMADKDYNISYYYEVIHSDLQILFITICFIIMAIKFITT